MAPAPVLLRAALPHDLPAMDRIAMAAKAHWGYASAQLERWRPDLTTRPDTIRSWPTYVAQAEGRVIGFAQLDPTATPWELNALFVDPACLRQGIGAGLLRHAVRHAREAGIDELQIDADPNALGFYLAFGARQVSALSAPIDGEPTRVRPQLRLPTAGA